jgi:hypothetical protein
MQVLLKADGREAANGTALVTHNERLVDPLDDFNMAIAAISGKRKKTHTDHQEMGRLEFYGGLYTEPKLTLKHINAKKNGCRPVIPAINVIRCLQAGASMKSKDGENVKRGIHSLAEFAVIDYEGPTDPVEMYKDDNGKFQLRKSVGIQRNRTMRTRPIFPEWQLSLLVEVDLNIFNLERVAAAWDYAGRYVGLCEMRPIYGRFTGTVEQQP